MMTPSCVGVENFDPTIHKIPVTDDAQAQEIIDREFDPEIHKAPVSKEFMACALGGHVEVEEELLDHFKNALFDGIAGMIYSIARKYSTTSPDEVGDLAHECIFQIWREIHKYDPTRATFNTWAWRVSENKLRRNYQKSRRHLERYAEWNEAYDNYGEEETPVEMNGDIACAINELLDKYPDKADIISEMFCRTDGSMYVPEKISMRKVARSVGRDYPEVYSFIRNKVRPFFKDKFGEEESEH
jgi:RNA polymerase sigma factor (sigma-70 family)